MSQVLEQCALPTEVLENTISNLTLVPGLDDLVETNPSTALLRMLTENTIMVSNGLSVAERMHRVQERTALHNFNNVGNGTCGEVYHQAGAHTGTLSVLKRAKTDDWAKHLWNDYVVHTKVLEAFDHQHDIDIYIPNVLYFIPKNKEEWWARNEHRFSRNVTPQAMLVSERIMPVHPAIRRDLIKLYCRENNQDAALSDPSNADCLIRVYLGRRRLDPSRKTMFFSLRNFNFHIDQMDDLGLDPTPFAATMGKTLAVMHWQVRCDARDVEFVLGGAPVKKDESTQRVPYEKLSQLRQWTSTLEMTDNFTRPPVYLWLLDFNQVRPIDMDKNGVNDAVNAFMNNDPYFPRPLAIHPTDQEVWSAFKDAYLRTSAKLRHYQEFENATVVEWTGLPEAFIDAVVHAQQKKQELKIAAAMAWN